MIKKQYFVAFISQHHVWKKLQKLNQIKISFKSLNMKSDLIDALHSSAQLRICYAKDKVTGYE